MAEMIDEAAAIESTTVGVFRTAATVKGDNLGVGMGLVGSMKNAGKVAGPVLAGAMIAWLDFTITFQIMGAALLLGAVGVRLTARRWSGPSSIIPARSER